jgi:hypothetical protein
MTSCPREKGLLPAGRLTALPGPEAVAGSAAPRA